MTNTHDKPRFNFGLYALAVQLVAALAPIADGIRRRNRELADQMERALTSVPQSSRRETCLSGVRARARSAA